MIVQGTPAQAGMPEESIRRFLSAVRREGVNLHSVLMARGDTLFFEKYWAPYTADTVHRMYSVTKSFVSIAIGCLIDEGKLRLDDPILGYFPDKRPKNASPLLEKQTIRDMLTMRTCFVGGNWFRPEVRDRAAFYFAQAPQKPADTLFDYDSTGSYILGVLAERLSGMPLLDYLKSRVLDRIGGFETAQLLQTPDGTPWGDSALLCTPRALLNFARFVMNKGTWEGKRLLSDRYLSQAVARQTDNNLEGDAGYNRHGYGYQIWRTERNSFSFNGMGSQFAICVPDLDFLFVCTADTQLTSTTNAPALFRAVFDHLVEGLPGQKTPPEDDPAAPLSLSVARGEGQSAFAAQIRGRVFRCEENPMGIRWFRLDWDEEGNGCFRYQNAQGEKRLPFGMKKNIFGHFPQAGYSDERGNVHELTDFYYRCAASAGWVDERTLQIRVQIIDRYLGILIVTFGFTGTGLAGVRMMKCAEDFLNEYEGWMIAHQEEKREEEPWIAAPGKPCSSPACGRNTSAATTKSGPK